MNKGISAIIATILLLMITIALAGTAYVYMSGMITGRTSKTISIADVSCVNGNITVVISNDGTSDIADGEIRVFIDNEDKTTTYGDLDPITSHNTSVDVSKDTNYGSGSHNVLVISPSNSDKRVVYC